MAEIGRPKAEITKIKDQAIKLAMGYDAEFTHETRNANNVVVNKTVDIQHIPGSVDALRLWKELSE